MYQTESEGVSDVTSTQSPSPQRAAAVLAHPRRDAGSGVGTARTEAVEAAAPQPEVVAERASGDGAGGPVAGKRYDRKCWQRDCGEGCVACGGRGYVSASLAALTNHEIQEHILELYSELGERAHVERYPHGVIAEERRRAAVAR